MPNCLPSLLFLHASFQIDSENIEFVWINCWYSFLHFLSKHREVTRTLNCVGLLVLRHLSRSADMVGPWTVSATFRTVLGAGAQVLVTGPAGVASGRRHWDCPMMSTGSSSHCNGPTTGYSWAPQPRRQRLGESVLKKGQNAAWQCFPHRTEEKKSLRNSLASTKVSEKRAGSCAAGARAGTALQPMGELWRNGLSPCSLWRDHTGSDIHAADLDT